MSVPLVLRWLRQLAAIALTVTAVAACGGAGAHPAGTTQGTTATAMITASLSRVASTGSSAATTRPAASQPATINARSAVATTAAAVAQPTKLPLAGKVVGIDPGHNGANGRNPTRLNHEVWNGRAWEGCDTTGTETDDGYTESRYNWNVARYLQADLRRLGAKVVLTRHSNDGFGPCVNTRARIIDRAHANVAVDIHADGGPASGRGFAILEPVSDGVNRRVIASSDRFARILRSRFLAVTKMPESTYDGSHGLQPRDDLAGLNLTTVPKVLIECGNMRNATDARRLVSATFQRRAATALAQAIERFLTGRD